MRDGTSEGTRSSATLPTAEPSRLDIAGGLRGERIFITGATGFLGKVLVEKLLWSVPEVGKLLLLIRPGGDPETEQEDDARHAQVPRQHLPEHSEQEGEPDVERRLVGDGQGSTFPGFRMPCGSKVRLSPRRSKSSSRA